MAEDPLVKLKSIGRCIDRIGDDESGLMKIRAVQSKVCFLVINTDSIYRQNLGFAPLNDGFHIGQTFRNLGFDVYFTTTSSRSLFSKYFEVLLSSTSNHFVFVSTGQGNDRQHKLTGNWTTSDFSYHPLVFGDGYFEDSDFISFIERFRVSGCRVTFITDSSEVESIWCVGGGEIHGLQVPADVVSISSIIEEEAEDLSQSGTKAGIRQFPRGPETALGLFVRILCKNLETKPNINGKELEFNVRKILKAHGHRIVIGSSSEGSLSLPLFA